MADTIPVLKKFKQSDSPVEETNVQLDDDVEKINAELLKEANNALQQSNRIHVRPIVDESKLGIELFVGDKRDEFHGLIKTRYGDFIVHEIDPEGHMAKLTNLDPPEEQEPSSSTKLDDLVDQETNLKLYSVNYGNFKECKIDVTHMDKDMRTSLHRAIREKYDRLESSTISDSDTRKTKQNSADKEDKKIVKPDSTQQVEKMEQDETAKSETKSSESNPIELLNSYTEDIYTEHFYTEKKYILVTKRTKSSRPKNFWPRERPDYTHFILYKENKDTMDAIHNLASSVNMRPANFSSAGVKDKRAVTTQWLSSWRLEPKRLISACRRFNKRPFIKVGNFCFKKEPLRLGQLKANKFDIVIRHLVHNSDGIQVIEKAMESIKTKGYVNYFGLQRFGTRSILTHEIGLAVLQEKWAEAVDLILSYRYDDNRQPPANKEKTSDGANGEVVDDSSNLLTESQKPTRNRSEHERKHANGAEQHNSFIDLWKLKLDAEIVFKKYPHFRYTNEGLIMKSLSKSEELSRDHLTALISLPRNTRSMYVHSYQSLLWNQATTYRLKKYGFKVIPGDLILSSDANISDNSLDILLLADEIDLSEDNKNNEADSNAGNNNRKVPVEELNSKIVIATEKDVDKYSIFDVVLPIIGSRVRLPDNDVGLEYKRLLENDNLTLESFRAREKLFISYGSYRKIMVKPNNVKWRIKQYSHPQQNLVETDLDLLNRELSKEKESSEKPTSPPKSDSSDEALIVEFELPSSSYATMCLREIMKKPSTDFNNKF